MGVPVYKRILDLFEAEGVNTLFGIPDPNFVHMFTEAEARGWSVVAPHHELSAGFMAEAASRMTGKPGLCIGTLGPGVANIAGAMMCALVENSPVIFLGGQRARITERRVRRGRIQFVQQEGLFTPSVKYSSSIEYADQTDEIVHEAIRRSMSGTPGPSYIEFPSHVILEELDVAGRCAEPSAYRLVNQGAGAREVAEAAKLIREAKSPILLVGHGVHTSRTQARGQGTRRPDELPGDPDVRWHVVHPGTAGPDVPLLVLARPQTRQSRNPTCVWRWVPNSVSRCTTAGLSIGPATMRTANGCTSSRTRPPSASTAGSTFRWSAICAASCRSSSRRCGTPRAPRHPTSRPWSRPTLPSWHGWPKRLRSGRTPVHPARYVVEATKAFDEFAKDGIMVRDGGATVIFQWTYSQSKPRDVIWNQNFGHLGTGLPYAVGASVAEGGKRPVMLLTSDSAFLFHIAELETAARQNLPLVCVVGVDHQWGLEVGVYKRTFEQPSPQPGVHWSKDVRFDKIAEGFGCHGEFVEKEDEIGPAIERAYASGKTAVVHVCIDPTANSEEMPKYDRFRTWYAEGTQ